MDGCKSRNCALAVTVTALSHGIDYTIMHMLDAKLYFPDSEDALHHDFFLHNTHICKICEFVCKLVQRLQSTI